MKIALAPLLDALRVLNGMLLFKVGEAGGAETAGDCFEVEPDIIVQSRPEDAQQMAAKLFARGTAKAVAAPDGA